MKTRKYTNSLEFMSPSVWKVCGSKFITLLIFLSVSAFGSLSYEKSEILLNPVDQESLVDVLVISDGATWISIPEARMKPNRFKEKTVRLSPGEYTIVARKKGYEEVKIIVSIEKGVPHPPITVICDKEKS